MLFCEISSFLVKPLGWWTEKQKEAKDCREDQNDQKHKYHGPCDKPPEEPVNYTLVSRIFGWLSPPGTLESILFEQPPVKGNGRKWNDCKRYCPGDFAYCPALVQPHQHRHHAIAEEHGSVNASGNRDGVRD